MFRPHFASGTFEHPQPGGVLPSMTHPTKRPQKTKASRPTRPTRASRPTRPARPTRSSRAARTVPAKPNEWLRVVKSLGELMTERVEAEAPQREKTLLDRPAIDALNRAYSAMLRYYTHLLAGGRHDDRVQSAISRLWQQAGTRMKKFDSSLAQRLKASNSFWSQDVTWQQATIQEAWAHLNSIRVCANRMDPDLRSPFSVS
jgi:hypothetical protein